MSDNIYFDDLRILEDSPLLHYLNLKPGRYYATWYNSSKTLVLKKHHGRREIHINVTLEQLMVILKTVQSQREGFQSHHVVPTKVCERSKLVIRANFCGFNQDEYPNRLSLPVTFHRGSHPKYSDFVEGILEDEWSDLVQRGEENDCPSVLEILNGAISYFRDKLQEMSKKGLCTINEIFPKY